MIKSIPSGRMGFRWGSTDAENTFKNPGRSAEFIAPQKPILAHERPAGSS